jgi:hypothetical protein
MMTNTLKELKLYVKMRSGEYCAASVGVTLVLYYAKSMEELADVVPKMYELYQSFIPERALRSLLGTTGVWRKATKQALTSRFRQLHKEGVDYTSINLNSGELGHLGDYGFHFFGSDLCHTEIYPRETCSFIMEFPIEALAPEQRERFKEFVMAASGIADFESGYGGYAFKHLSMTWRGQALDWIFRLTQHYLALDISNNSFDSVARRRVVNVSWITLLGHDVTADLGGTERIREQLSPEVKMQSLTNGTMLIAGDTPPIGDTNGDLQDIRWLKEVAALTKPVRAKMEIGFGSPTFRRTWLNRLDISEKPI